MPGAGAPGSLLEDVALPVRHEREVPSWIQSRSSSPVSSHIRPEVTT